MGKGSLSISIERNITARSNSETLKTCWTSDVQQQESKAISLTIFGMDKVDPSNCFCRIFSLFPTSSFQIPGVVLGDFGKKVCSCFWVLGIQLEESHQARIIVPFNDFEQVIIRMKRDLLATFQVNRHPIDVWRVGMHREPKNPPKAFTGRNVSGINKVLDLINLVLIVPSNCNAGSVVTLVDIFEEIFHCTDGATDLNIDMSIILGSQP